jgi:hypothetical protein
LHNEMCMLNVYDIFEMESDMGTVFMVVLSDNILGYFDTLAEADECVKKHMDQAEKILLN